MLEPRARSRIAESVDETDYLRSELDGWLTAASSVATSGQYQTQLDTLAAVLTPVLAGVRRQINDLPSGMPTASVYDECRRTDRRVVFVRRLWQWFAVRFDQRRDRYGEVLRAADEVVWSCWSRTWEYAGWARPGPAPLPYVDAVFGAATNPRVDVPAELRAVADATLAAQVTAMPVPVIALPARVAWRPWWLVLLAHETGHHVQYDLSPGADQPARDAVAKAAAEAGAGDDEQERWRRWAVELFADAYAALLVGPAIAWAVDELEYRGGDGLLRSPAPTYPPPTVRLAILAAVLGDHAAAAPATDTRLGRDVQMLLRRVPAVASTLLSVPIGDATLGSLAARSTDWRRAAATWRRELMAAADPKPVKSVDAARLCVAGGVAAWRALAVDDAAGASRLRTRLLSTVPLCRVDGVRASAPPPAAEIDAAATSLLDTIFSAAVEEQPA